VLADTERVYEPNKRDNDVSLNVFGHQLYYSKDNIYDEISEEKINKKNIIKEYFKKYKMMSKKDEIL
jgi:hypothetical protein